MTAIPAASSCQPAAQSAALEGENALSPNLKSPQATSATLRAGCRFFDAISGVFRFVHKNASSLLPYLSKRIAGIFSSVYTPSAISSPPAQWSKKHRHLERAAAATGGAEVTQTENNVAGRITLCELPQLPIEHIFHSLAPNDKIALSRSCRAFRQLFQRSCQQRCQLLLDSDAGKHAFGRFGIKCPDAETAAPGPMYAMVARVTIIIRSMNEVVKTNFPQSSACTQTAEELVWQLPPAHLQGLLETAYQCNLYSLFARHARPVGASTLGEATATIRAWALLHNPDPA